MEQQLGLIKDFITNASFIMVRYDKDEHDLEFGKILTGKELDKIDLGKNEIHRSISNKDDSKLFVFDLKPSEEDTLILSPLQLIKQNLRDARMIEEVYPKIFTWVFDGASIKAMAIVPSHDPKQHSTISRYGGTDMFIKILQQHLENISNMSKGRTPDYNFLKSKKVIKETELSIGSINKNSGLKSIVINLDDDYITIVKKSKNVESIGIGFTELRMKYWAREINPDFITEAKHIKLKETLNMDYQEAYKYYPQAIKNLMAMKHKGNYNRFLLTRFLLAAHKPSDAKFIYYSVLSPEELEHVKNGNCSTQWNYVLNNMKRYDCPTFEELNSFKSEEDKELSHPLELIQKYLDGKLDEKEDDE